MKKMYYEEKNGRPINVDIQNAIDGAEYNNYEVIPFTFQDVLCGNYDREVQANLFVGSINTMSFIFSKIGFKQNLDLPEELFPFISRKISIMKCSEAIKNKNIFIKPVKTKLFDGVVFSENGQKSYFRDYMDEECYVSELIEIISEYRVFVSDSRIIYSANYSGDFMKNINYGYVKALVLNMKHKPISFTIDVALLKNGKSELIEINDFWSIGGYGLYCEDYFKMLKNRYFEILNSV